jgi:hypothetical protein
MLDSMTIFMILVQVMAHDNCAHFAPTVSQTKRGMQAILVMQSVGIEFPMCELERHDGIFWTIGAGDEKEVNDRYGDVPGYQALSNVLNEIFNRESEK